eukprot:TRINITY_DN114670_c0_g1_i1.p1 TRINITY_DN114670_c0_g1~~TRINITY_DN114670_c0_g1_i1.p1  ORF type:complete len:146 (-),score=6.11 TRINITY_DN114670_c0_g1_i1:45-482(-)
MSDEWQKVYTQRKQQDQMKRLEAVMANLRDQEERQDRWKSEVLAWWSRGGDSDPASNARTLAYQLNHAAAEFATGKFQLLYKFDLAASAEEVTFKKNFIASDKRVSRVQLIRDPSADYSPTKRSPTKLTMSTQPARLQVWLQFEG